MPRPPSPSSPSAEEDRRSTTSRSFSGTPGRYYYSQGLGTFRVPMTLYGHNRARVVETMMSSSTTASFEGGSTTTNISSSSSRRRRRSGRRGLVLLEGGKQTTRYDTDHEPVFRQESYFHYLFGASQYSDCYGAISIPDGRSTLFVPRWGVDVATVCGACPDLEDVRGELGVDEVLGVDDLGRFVEGEMSRMIAEAEEDDEDDEEEREEKKGGGGTKSRPKLYVLRGLNTDSGNYASPAHFEGIEKYDDMRDDETLFKCMAECRVTKSPAEIDLMRYTNWMSSMAHVEVMKACRPGMMEYQLESLFQHHTYTHGGCRHMSYTCICACGPNANILHYGHAGRPNSGRALASGDMALLDMGAEYHCYASDITCSYPVCGTFTDDQRAIYECVLAAQACVIGRLRPGISWVDMHRAAEGEILRGLIRCGVLHVPDGISHDDDGDDDAIIGEMIEADLGAVFMPHGLGHLIGIDTHDVGGYASGAPPRSDRPGLRKLRTARVLETGVVITVEPGCYFIDPLLDAALSDERQRRFIDVDRLNDFRGFGGVRLEDNVWITADGCENLTQCPRTVEEVLDVMKGGVWPPVKDVMPEMKRAWSICKGGEMEMLALPMIET